MRENISEDLRDHLEELKSMARLGQSTPVISGFYLAWWGLVLTLAALVSAQLINQGRDEFVAYVWPALVTVGWIVSRLLRRRMSANSNAAASTMTNRVTRAVWVFTGLVSTAIILLEATGMVDLAGRGYFLIFQLCALSFVVTAMVSYEPLLLMSGVGWALLGFASLLLGNSPSLIFMATAVATSACLALPGLIIAMRK